MALKQEELLSLQVAKKGELCLEAKTDSRQARRCSDRMTPPPLTPLPSPTVANHTQGMFDTLSESSAAVEKEYEAELERAEARAASLEREAARLKREAEEARARATSGAAEVGCRLFVSWGLGVGWGTVG